MDWKDSMDSIVPYAMDNFSLTHAAAIVVGVGLGFVFMRSVNKEAEAGASGGAAVADSNANNNSNGKKKKKKKSKTAPGVSTDTKKKVTKKSKSVPVPDSEEEEEEEATPIVPEKKKRIRKKKNKTTAAPEASNSSTPVTTTNSGDVSTKEQQQPSKAQWKQQRQQPAEDGWTVEGPKRRQNKPKVARASPTSSAVATDSVVFDAKKVGIIIGPKGATMKAIEEATGCKLDINAPSKDDPPPKGNKPQTATAVLTGSKDAMTKAKNAILELASKGYATILQSEGFAESSIAVHPRCLSEIVGPGGKTIQALQKGLDVKLTIPPTDWKPNSVQHQVNMCKVGIAGSKEAAKKTKAVIQSIVDFHHHPITHPGMIHEQVYVPTEFFHCVIGVRGCEIRHMRGNYGVDVHMPSADSITENVLVVGKKANVDKAITYITTLMDRDAEQREQKFSDEHY